MQCLRTGHHYKKYQWTYDSMHSWNQKSLPQETLYSGHDPLLFLNDFKEACNGFSIDFSDQDLRKRLFKYYFKKDPSLQPELADSWTLVSSGPILLNSFFRNSETYN